MSLLVELRILDARLRDWGLPRYHSDDAAAVDLHACVDAELLVAAQAPPSLVPAGIAVHIGDPGVAAVVLPRSGLGHRGLVLGNLVGLIDADYLGPIMLSVWNRNAPGTPPIAIAPGDRIAQLVFVPVVRPTLRVVSYFSRTTARGAAGFGSTGNAAGGAKDSNG